MKTGDRVIRKLSREWNTAFKSGKFKNEIVMIVEVPYDDVVEGFIMVEWLKSRIGALYNKNDLILLCEPNDIMKEIL